MAKTREICCRLCFCSDGSFLNIFDDVPSVLDIAEILKKYFQDEAKLSDPLPNIICCDCWRKTESFHEFHEKVLNDRDKYLNHYLDVGIKKEQESVLVTESQFDEFSENMCVDPIILQPIHIDDQVEVLNGYELVSNTSKRDNEISFIENNESISDNELIMKTDYQYESNSYSGGDDNREDFGVDDESNDENCEVTERPAPINSSLPTNIKHLSTSQMKTVVTEYFDMNCEKCETKFSGLEAAKIHYQFAHNIAKGYVKCCNLKFSEHKDYRGHILWHLNPKLYDCLICGSSHKTLKSHHAHKHFHKNRALRRFICDICNGEFGIKLKLIKHIMQVHAAKKKYFCEKCKNSFSSENQLLIHNRYVHSGLNTQLTPKRMEQIIRTKFDMKCEQEFCNKVFQSLHDAKKHYSDVHNILDGWIKCCNTKLKYNKETKEHIAWHINPTVFQCPECGRLCPSKWKLKKHMVSHIEKKCFTCGTCERSFATDESLNGHIRRTHFEHEICFECDYCHKNFLKKSKLIEHMQFIHGPEIQKVREAEVLTHFFDLTCDKCDDVFESLEEAITHYNQEHNGQNGYIKCCDLQFNNISLVKDHVKWHLDPDVFKCVRCNEKLPTRKALHSHTMHTHSRGPFICDICRKGYKVKQKLKSHILGTHVETHVEKKEQCGLCEEKFGNFKHLQTHLELKHLDDLNTIVTDTKNIPLLDLNDERMKEAMKKFVDQTCDICHVKLDSLTAARLHYLNEHEKPRGYLKCCKSKLSFESSLIDHLNWHVNPNIFRCRLCCKIVAARNSIMGHVKTHKALQSKRFSCGICSVIFVRIEKYRLHMETKHGIKIPKRRRFRDESPSSSMADPEEQDGHDQRWDVENSAIFNMTCDVNSCTKVFSSLSDARRHYLKVHNNPSGYVKCCDLKLRTSFDVSDHIAWHRDPECFKCEQCGRSYKRKRALLRHAECHTEINKCHICNKSYTRKTTLINHMLWHENRDKKLEFSCPDCNKSFYREGSLKAHRDRIHTSTEEKYICEFCAKGFRSESVLKIHSRNVHKQGPQKPKQKFQCDICLNFYSSKGILRTHKLTHSSDPFKCTMCDKLAPTAAALSLHMKAVHVEAKFNCHLCEKSFKLAPALKDHIATHLNNKQYNCTYCDESFIWRTNMYKHRKRIHRKEWETDKAKKEAEKKML